MSSGRVGNAFVDDNLLSYNKYVNLLVQNESPVLIYAGEFDAQDGPKTIEAWLRPMLDFDGVEDFWAQSRSIYWVHNATDSDPLINGGLYRSSPFFTFLTVPKAGHFVPANNYYPSFQFFGDYVRD